MSSQEEQNPWVIRTDFSDDAKWKQVCELIGAPQSEHGMEFFAYVRYVSDAKYSGLQESELVRALPDDYPGFFCVVADVTTFANDEFPLLVIGFSPNSVEMEAYQRTPSQTPTSEIQTFRAVPAAIQSIENNLSIANMDYEDFAASVEGDGVFRGFA